MQAFKSFLTRRSVLWASFIIFMLLNVGFFFWIPYVGGVILDESWGEGMQHIYDGMTPVQRRSHGWMTLILDMPYPLAYGVWYAGLALKAFPKLGWWIALPALLTIPIDLTENTTQVLALLGGVDVLSLKDIVTPLKLLFFISASLIALASLVLLLVRGAGKPKVGELR